MGKEFKLGHFKIPIEVRPLTEDELAFYNEHGHFQNGINVYYDAIEAGSPQIGDVVGRNPEDRTEQFIIPKEKYEKEFDQCLDTVQMGTLEQQDICKFCMFTRPGEFERFVQFALRQLRWSLAHLKDVVLKFNVLYPFDRYVFGVIEKGFFKGI